MKNIPYRKFTIELQNQPSEIEDRMMKELYRSQKNITSYFNTHTTCFLGYAINGKLFMHRKGFGNTTMIPIVKGEISNSKDNKGTKIELTVQYEPGVYAFLSLWLGAVVLVFFICLIESLINLRFNIGILVSFFMFMGAYLVSMISFNIEIETIKRFFNDQFFIQIK